MHTLADKYHHIAEGARAAALQKAQRLAALTIPDIYPQNTSVQSEPTVTGDWSSAGGLGLANVTAGLTNLTFPTGFPPLHLSVVLQQGELDPDELRELGTLLSQAEQTCKRIFDGSMIRSRIPEVFEAAMVGSQVLLDLRDEVPNVHLMDTFTAQRDGAGNWGDICQHVVVDLRTLDHAKAEAIMVALGDRLQPGMHYARLYTGAQRNMKGGWTIQQEAAAIGENELNHVTSYGYHLAPADGGGSVPWNGSAETLGKNDPMPLIPVSLGRRGRGNYPAPPLERIHGDLQTVSGLAESIVAMTANVANSLRLVDPNGQTDIDDLVGAPPSAYVPGRLQDVQEFTAGGTGVNINVVQSVQSAAERRLGQYFLSELEVRRDSERTTATEYMSMKQALERSNTGMSATAEVEVGVPVNDWILKTAVKSGKVSSVVLDDDERIQIQVTGGLTGLGAAEKIASIRQFWQVINETALLERSPEAIDWIAPEAHIMGVAANSGLDVSVHTRTPEEVGAIRQQRQQAQAQAEQGPALAQMQAKMMESELERE